MVEMNAPIFVLALNGRSGTNYLAHLLSAHPDVTRGQLSEDFLLHGAGKLIDYTDGLLAELQSHEWFERHRRDQHTADQLARELGSAMLRFVGVASPEGRPLLKTPRLGDLEAGLRLFPKCNMLILLRDPRSIVESALHAHWYKGASLEQQAMYWARSARYLEEFLKGHQHSVRQGHVRLVRYERLVQQPREETAKLLTLLELPQAPSVLERAEQSPVIGSSFLPRRSDGRIDFTPTPPPADFDPICRWRDWSLDQHRRFNRVCGALMERWGYKMVTGESQTSV